MTAALMQMLADLESKYIALNASRKVQNRASYDRTRSALKDALLEMGAFESEIEKSARVTP